MFFRIFGVKCDRCGLVLSPHDLVMRTMSYIYHLGCFQCVMCGQSLQVNNQQSFWQSYDAAVCAVCSICCSQGRHFSFISSPPSLSGKQSNIDKGTIKHLILMAKYVYVCTFDIIFTHFEYPFSRLRVNLNSNMKISTFF